MNILTQLNQSKLTGRVMNQSHPTLPLTIWNYTQQTQYNRDWDELTLMSRGLVVDERGEIVGRPFQKFFNLNETPYLFSQNHLIYEKLDGSFISLFYYNDQWVFASRGSFTSIYAQKAESLFVDHYSFDVLDPEYTYMFEVIFKEGRIVVLYETERLVLIGKRHTQSGRYVSIDPYREYGFDVVKEYSNLSFDELQDLEWENAEGFVVRFVHDDGLNDDFVKIKFDEYVRLHRIMTNISTKSIWELLKSGENVTEILSNVPDEFFDKIRNYEKELRDEFNRVNTEVTMLYNRVIGDVDPDGSTELTLSRGDYARKVKEVTTNSKYQAILFKMYDGKSFTHLIWDILQPEYRLL